MTKSNLIQSDDIRERIEQETEPHKDKEILAHLFNDSDLRQATVAEILGVSDVAVWNAQKRHGISTGKTGRPSNQEKRATEAASDDSQSSLGEWSE